MPLEFFGFLFFQRKGGGLEMHTTDDDDAAGRGAGIWLKSFPVQLVSPHRAKKKERKRHQKN